MCERCPIFPTSKFVKIKNICIVILTYITFTWYTAYNSDLSIDVTIDLGYSFSFRGN